MTETLENMYRIDCFPAKIPAEQLRALANGMRDAARAERGESRSGKLQTWLVSIASNEISRRQSNASDVVPTEATRPVMPLLNWSDVDIADSLVFSLHFRDELTFVELQEFLVAVHFKIVREAGLRLRRSCRPLTGKYS